HRTRPRARGMVRGGPRPQRRRVQRAARRVSRLDDPGRDAASSMSALRRIRAVFRVVLVLGLAWGFGATFLEKRRRAAAVRRAAPAPHELSVPSIHADLVALSSPDMEGRAVGTPGGRKAREWVARRFAEIGLAPLGSGFVKPFRFTHTSIKALWRRDR